MQSYIGNPQATHNVFAEHGWYIGLGDICFYLQHGGDNASKKDYYWQSRVSNLLIRGGANYSCEYIAGLVQNLPSKCVSA